MRKYNLTIWQWIGIPLLYALWLTHDKSKRKESFHLVLKGMEKHEHKYTIPNNVVLPLGKVVRFMDCEHEGCNMTNPIDV